MKIVMQTIYQTEQRYDTDGDYWEDPDGTIQIRATAGPDAVEILLHEFIEFMLCKRRGIHEPDILAFDLAHLKVEDPGMMQDAPYHKEHVFADAIDRLMSLELSR